MASSKKSSIDTKNLKQLLLQKHEESKQTLATHHPHAIEFFKNVGIEPGKIRHHAAHLLTTSVLTSALLLGSPAPEHIQLLTARATSPLYLEQSLSQALSAILPPTVEQLSEKQESAITTLIKKSFGISATAVLDSNRLNRDYGYIGAEQHLYRFPGDTLDQHELYTREGIAPGLGAWRYFANSRQELTNTDIQQEKYYVAVQTLYLPDFHERVAYYRDWYKYRKMLVVNPANGKSIVAVVGDVGPAAWTGKHFGGSPEVMAYLGLNVGKQKGAVLMLFVDDPNDEVSLGPLEYNKKEGKAELSQI